MGISNPSSFKTLGDVHVILKSSDETINNTNVLQDDDELQYSLPANSIWLLDLCLLTNSAAVADFQLGWGYPAGATMAWCGPFVNTAGASAVLNNGAISDTRTLEGQGDTRIYRFSGVLSIAAAAGSIVVKWAQAVANVSDCKVLAKSFLILTRLDG